jgi:integrase
VVAELKAYLDGTSKGASKSLVEHALEYRVAYMKASTQVDPETLHSPKDEAHMAIWEMAQEEIDQRHGSKAAIRFAQVALSTSPILRQMVDPWLQQAGDTITKQTAYQHRTALDAFLEWITKEGLDAESTMARDVDRKLAGRFIGEGLSTSGKAPRTINRYISSLSSFWKWLIKRGLVEEAEGNPWERQGVPSETKRGVKVKRRAFTNTEISKLLIGDAQAKVVPSETLKDLMALGLYTGARLDELCSLRVEDVTDSSGNLTLVVSEGKTKAALRRVPVHPCIAHVIARRTKGSKDGYLFHELKPSGPDLKRGWKISNRFTDYRRKVVIDGPDTVFHSFRKNTAGALEAAGVPETTAALILGHDRPHMTYGLYNDGGVPIGILREAIERITYGQVIDDLVRHEAVEPTNQSKALV